MDPRPDILIFNPDQFRADAMGHLGNPAAVTPNFDAAVTKDFVSFSNAYCQATVCTPSRCSFMSGWYPHTRGHRTMHHMLHPERGETNLLRELKRSGYEIIWAGKNDLVPAQNGYEEHADVMPDITTNVPSSHSPEMNALRGEPGGDNWYSFFLGRYPEGESADAIQDADWARIRAVCDLIRDQGPRGANDPPRCIYLPIDFPHPPYIVEEPFFSLIDRAALPSRIETSGHGKPAMLEAIRAQLGVSDWSEERWNELRAVYLGMVARVDEQFGLLLGALRETQRYDETAVFVLSDHGDFTGDYGLVEKTQNTFEDCLTNVPLMVKLPSSLSAGVGIREDLVELIDFTATCYSVAGIEPDYDHFGRNLLPVIEKTSTVDGELHRDAVFCEGGRLPHEVHCAEQHYPGSDNPENWYYPRMMAQRDPMAHGKAAMVRTAFHKYVRRLSEADELYDLKRDPEERDNRIDDPAYAEVVVALRLRLLDWYQTTCDVVPREHDQRW